MAEDSREHNLLNESISIRDQLDAKIDIVLVNPKYVGEMSILLIEYILIKTLHGQ